jgi:predicted DNA binding protein
MAPLVNVRAMNEQHRYIGEDHHSAELTDREVDAIREAYDRGDGGYRTLARQFDCSSSTIRNIVKCRQRAQSATSYRRKKCEHE